MTYSLKDERICLLVHAKNDLSLALELKNKTIQELRNEIASLRAGEIKLKETIKKLEIELKILKETSAAVADDIHLTDKESETVSTYESFDDEPTAELVDKTEMMNENFKHRVGKLLQTFKNRKLRISNQFGKNKFLVDAYKTDFEFANSVKLPEEAEIRTEEKFKEVQAISSRLRHMINNLNDAYDYYTREKSVSLLKKFLPETVDVPTNNDLSTQTDFNAIPKNCLSNLNKLRLTHLEPASLMSALKMKLMISENSRVSETLAMNKKIDNLSVKFEVEAKKKMTLIEVNTENETAFMAYVKRLRKYSGFPLREEIRKLVINDMASSTAAYIENSFVPISNSQSVRSCSSQTDISTLVIKFNFEPVAQNDSLRTQKQKLFGQMAKYSIERTINVQRCNRLMEYFDDLKANKKISVQQSDLSAELKTALVTSNSVNSVKIEKAPSEVNPKVYDKMSKQSIQMATESIQSMHLEIFAQLERKVKSTLNFEIDAAIKKSTESIQNHQLTSNSLKLQRDEMENKLLSKDNIIDEQSKKIASFDVKNAEAERKLRYETSDKNLANLKLKESHKLLKERESEISKLNAKISNQNKTNSQQQQAMNLKCKEIQKLKTELNKMSSQQTSQVEVNKLKTKITQLEVDVRRYKNASSSVSQLEAELHNYKSAAGTVTHLKNQLAEEKKKLKGSGDKPCSEYEMLLSEKDAIIAEYISGSFSKN